MSIRIPAAAETAGFGRLAATLLTLWGLGTLGWWVLAFPPLVDAPPAWLTRLQEVCFGTDAAGAPALYGWGALIAGPLGLLASMLTGWARELRSGVRALWRGWLGRALLGVLVVALAGESGWVLWRARTLASGESWPAASPVTELPPDYPRLDRPLPGFRLVDQHGQLRTPESFRGRPALLTFAYGHCTTVCPVTIASVLSALNDARALEPAGIIVTLDAWRDTPGTLDSLAQKWGLPPSAVVLSGRPAEVVGVLDALQVVWARNERTGDIDHVALVYVLDPRGRIAYALSNPPPQWLAEALSRAVR